MRKLEIEVDIWEWGAAPCALSSLLPNASSVTATNQNAEEDDKRQDGHQEESHSICNGHCRAFFCEDGRRCLAVRRWQWWRQQCHHVNNKSKRWTVRQEPAGQGGGRDDDGSLGGSSGGNLTRRAASGQQTMQWEQAVDDDDKQWEHAADKATREGGGWRDQNGRRRKMASNKSVGRTTQGKREMDNNDKQ